MSAYELGVRAVRNKANKGSKSLCPFNDGPATCWLYLSSHVCSNISGNEFAIAANMNRESGFPLDTVRKLLEDNRLDIASIGTRTPRGACIHWECQSERVAGPWAFVPEPSDGDVVYGINV